MPDRSHAGVIDKAHRMGLRSALARRPTPKYTQQFYDELLAEFTTLTAKQIATNRDIPLQRVEGMIKRARRSTK